MDGHDLRVKKVQDFFWAHRVREEANAIYVVEDIGVAKVNGRQVRALEEAKDVEDEVLEVLWEGLFDGDLGLLDGPAQVLDVHLDHSADDLHVHVRVELKKGHGRKLTRFKAKRARKKVTALMSMWSNGRCFVLVSGTAMLKTLILLSPSDVE